MSDAQSLLFITSSCLGDAVLTTGLLSHLIKKHPGIHVTVACGAIPAPLFEGVPHLKQCLSIQRASFSRHWFSLWRKAYPERWTTIVDLRGTALSFFLRCDGERWIWKSSGKIGHQVERLGQVLGLTPPPSPQLWTTSAHEEEATRLLKGDQNVIAIAPASNWLPKTWPLSHWKVLIEELVSPHGLFPDAAILVMGAAHERADIENLFKAFPHIRWIDTIGRAPLLTLYACLKRVRLFIGNDSGLMHLAAASGAPTVGLFGPTDRAQYGPWGAQTIIAQTPYEWQKLRAEAQKNPYLSAMSSLSVSIVLEKISKLLDHPPINSAVNQ